MTKFLVSARKYRPQTFGELVSQNHVGETLRNAIRLDRLAHAYLFCGPRGVGKTSAARILAKTVNCLAPADERPDLDPCRKCDSCVSFEQGRSLNVIEIDAASNNSVDDIRALRETVRVPPQVGAKKVYIIDEVHMLSKQAFNALLKTLEEPPPFVQFLFATTEPQKVIPTILSRCQRFDFRRISIPDIVNRLRGICEEEGIEADEPSLRLIARKGDGALRDAFSTFDQSVLLCGKNIEYQALVEALGAVDIDVYFETAGLIAEGDRAGLLRLVDRLVNKGYDITEFVVGLTDHFRNLLVTVTTGTTDLIETDRDTAERYGGHGSAFHEADLLRHLIVVDETMDSLRRSVNPRLRLELALLKMASLGSSADLQQLLQQLGTPDASSESSSEEPSRRQITSAINSGVTTPAPKVSEPSSTEIKEPVLETISEIKLVKPLKTVTTAEPVSNSASKLFGSPAILKPVTRKESASKDASTLNDSSSGKEEPSIVPFSRLETAWDSYITAVMQDRIHVGALLQHAIPSSIVGSIVEIAVPDDFHERLLGSESVYLGDKLGTTLSLSPPPSVKIVISDSEGVPEAVPELDAGERIQKLKEQNPIIEALIEKFGGEVVW
jgi:DNA polymerase-3 subunit gamma/tau